MKKNIYFIVLSVLVLYILLFPQDAVKAASVGLILWYTKMLPTLLPFAILSYIFVATDILNAFTVILHKFLRHILPISSAGIYPLMAGFLFGFPMGSRITAQMVEHGQMDYQEGCRIFSICNNISPAFITSYILSTCLKRPDLTLVTFVILYAPPLVYFVLDAGFQTRKNHKKQPFHVLHAQTGPETQTASHQSGAGHPVSTKNAASRSQINFKIIDAGIMNGFETLTKLGGYIMMFAIFAQMTTLIPFPGHLLNCILTGLMEITNGISCISMAPLTFETKYLLMIFCTAFGGFSGLAQTASMTKAAGFPMKKYLRTKIICSIASVFLALLFVIW